MSAFQENALEHAKNIAISWLQLASERHFVGLFSSCLALVVPFCYARAAKLVHSSDDALKDSASEANDHRVRSRPVKKSRQMMVGSSLLRRLTCRQPFPVGDLPEDRQATLPTILRGEAAGLLLSVSSGCLQSPGPHCCSSCLLFCELLQCGKLSGACACSFVSLLLSA